jgi:hypothetical protein
MNHKNRHPNHVVEDMKDKKKDNIHHLHWMKRRVKFLTWILIYNENSYHNFRKLIRIWIDRNICIKVWMGMLKIKVINKV